MAVEFKKLVHTYPSGTNSYTFTDSLINDNSVIEVYTDNDDIYPVDVEQTNHSVLVKIVDHSSPTKVCITINNVSTYSPVDISGIQSELNGLSTAVSDLADDVADAEGDIIDLITEVNNLSMNKQDKLTAGQNITIENNVISASGGGGSVDIVDNLTSTATDKALSANMGRALKAEVDDKASTTGSYTGMTVGLSQKAQMDRFGNYIDVYYLSKSAGVKYENLDSSLKFAIDRIPTVAKMQEWDAKQNALTAGTNITIDENNVISASGGGGVSDWSDISDKPFESIGDTLVVANGILNTKPTLITTSVVTERVGGEDLTQYQINEIFRINITNITEMIGTVNSMLEEV